MQRSAKTTGFHIFFCFGMVAVSLLTYFVLIFFDIRDISGTYVLSNMSTFESSIMGV